MFIDTQSSYQSSAMSLTKYLSIFWYINSLMREN